MSDIDEIKSRLSIVDIINEKVPLKKAGRNFKANCPFHSEKTPSFMVSPERQVFHCFGCGKGGSVIDFVMEYEHVDFLEALEDLAVRAGVKLERRAPDTPQDRLKEKIYEVNHLASEFYHYLLTKHALGEKARVYLKNRGISEKSIETFMLGYSPNSWEGCLRFLRKKGYDEELLGKAGLVVSTSKPITHYYDRFRGRVMFTLKDHRGNVVGFSGRVLDPEIKEAKYINTSETPVYIKGNVLYGLDVTRQAIAKENEAIIMEGEFDVISSFQSGISNVVAIKGSALTEGQVQLLHRFTDSLVFALDSDLAGDAAARRGIETAEKAGFEMKVVKLAGGKDPDEVVRQNPGLLKKAVKSAISIYDYFIESSLKRFDVATAYGKKKIAREALSVISKIDNPIVQGHYLRSLAKTLDVGEATILDELSRIKKEIQTARTSLKTSSSGKPDISRREKTELYLLALLLQGNTATFWQEFKNNLILPDIGSIAVRRILEELGKYLEKHEDFLIKNFAAALPSELTAKLDEAFLWDVSSLLISDEVYQREWQRTILELRRLILRQKMQNKTKEIKEPYEKNETELEEIKIQLKDLTSQFKDLDKEPQI